MAWPAAILAALYFLFDVVDAYGKFFWHSQIKRSPAVRSAFKNGRRSNEHFHNLTFTVYAQKFDFRPTPNLGKDAAKVWSILVVETFLSRLRRRISLAPSPPEIQFVEVAHRRIELPPPGHIASFNTWEWPTLVMRNSAFYVIGFHTNREELSPGRRIQLESGHTIVKMSDVHVSGDLTLDGRHVNANIIAR